MLIRLASLRAHFTVFSKMIHIPTLLRYVRTTAVLAGVVALMSSVQAQSPTPASVPSEGGIVFPIEELGNCSDLGTCLSFCDDPVNHGECVAYAKEKGFYEEDPVVTASAEFWAKAETELGCNSREACEDFCADGAHHATCHEYATAEGIVGGYVIDPQKEAVVEAAETVLGCDSYGTCRDFCADAANADACSNFAHQVGLLGGEVAEGPGGCKTEESSEIYCQDPNNFSECAVFIPPEDGTFTGPGGCDSEQTCHTYCEENPDECRTFAPGTNGVYVPITCGEGEFLGPGGVCTAEEATDEAGACAQGGQFWDGNSCEATPPPGIVLGIGTAFFEPREEMGGCSTPAECFDYCAANPGSCAGVDTSRPRPDEGYHPYIYYTPGSPVKFEPKPELGNCDSPGSCYDYCQANPTACQGFNPTSPRPLDVYVPGTYYTPPADVPYFTPPAITYYVTPLYFTPPADSNYTTPTYYTPGQYTTPTYATPRYGHEYVTPTYYTPGQYYSTPSGSQYPTPTYSTPTYYTPPLLSGYTTPNYYTPPQYTTPFYPTPPLGSIYNTPTYATPPPYGTPSYHTPPGSLLGHEYTTPTYYTPPPGSGYATPSYATPQYYTPGGYYTPTYYTPSDSGYRPIYYSPHGSYNTPTYHTPPEGSTYTSPTYPSPTYYSPTYLTPSYATPPAGSTYTSPTYHTPYGTPSTTGSYYYPSPPSGSYSYPTPSSTGSYSYPSPSYASPATGYSYPTPSYSTPGTYSYPTPTSGDYHTPSSGAYSTPSYSYPTPSESYSTPSSYGTPESYGTPASYDSPYSYPTPSDGGVHGTRIVNPFTWLWNWIR